MDNDMNSLVSHIPPGRFSWWIRLTAPPGAQQYDKAPTHQERERLRRSQLVSFTAPFVFLAPLLLLQQATDLGTMIAIVTLMAVSLFALVFNRMGRQTLAAMLLVLSMDAVIEGALVTAPGGLSSGWLLSFDLFVIPLITVGVLLNRRFLWVFALLHIGFILGDFYLLPHDADLVALIQKWHGPAIAFARPLIIQIGAGLLSFIEVKSTEQAIRRADRAQFIITLQQSIAREKQRRDEGIQKLLTVLTQASNGNFPTHINLSQDNELWRIGQALEVLFQRLRGGKLTEQWAQQLMQEIQMVTSLVHAARAGQPVQWPTSGGLLDPLIKELEQLFGTNKAPRGLGVRSRSEQSPLEPW